MADNRERIHAEDVLPVMSRISWGAIIAGAFVALAVYVLLSMIGVAIGLGLANELSGETIATGGGIWALASLLIALAAGGCVTTTCTAGENKQEAVIYGVILWGVVFVMTLWMTGSVVRMGTSMLIGSANAVADVAPKRINWDRAAEDAGLSEAQLDKLRGALPSAEQARAMGTEAALWSLAGIVVSMAAAIGGALLGAGTTLRLSRLVIRPADHSVHGGTPSPSR